MAKFIDAFFSKFNEFHKPPRHPKWSEANWNIKISGCNVQAADEWLAEHARATTSAVDLGSFDRFLSQTGGAINNLSPEDKAVLFRQFLEWQRAQRSAQ